MSPGASRLARSQETLWEFVSCFAPSDPGVLGYNVFETTTWDDSVDVNVFRRAVGDVIARHDALRIVFDTLDIEPRLRILDGIDPPVQYADLTAEPASRQELLRGSILGVERGRAFDLRNGPLWSVVLLRTAPRRYVVAVTLFHLIADGWSTGVLLRDLRAAYLARTGEGPAPRPLRLSYAAATADPQLDPAARRRRDDFWRRTLTPLPDAWPFEGAPQQGQTPDVTAEATLGLPIEPGLIGRLHAFARAQRITPFLLYLAAYRILLGARTGRPRLVLGTATAGRDEPGAEDLVGQFTHNVYVASTIGPDATLLDGIGTVRTAMYEAVRHTASFTEIARAVNPDFDALRPWPFLLLYHSWFQSAAPTTDPPPDRREHRSRARRPAGVVLDDRATQLWARRGEPGLVVRHDRRGASMNYNPTIYPRATMLETLEGYTTVLNALLTDPDQRLGDLKLP
ncbi:condensation domain-containing protein [Dactylosporangium sp. NPDC050688]|uniref:condensation domain-containing protein n=1 Tax=Dactylosporangium sp. NPDC050688 TaxID=3157217 RepID=UPI00340F15DC